MGISGFFGKNNLSRVLVDVRYPEEVFAGKPTPLTIAITNNRKFLPVFLLKIHISNQDIFFPFIDCMSSVKRTINVMFDKRGEYVIDDIYIYSVFPFNFFTRYRRLQAVFRVIAFPEPKRCELLTMCERHKHLKGEKTSDKYGYEADLVSIREYVHGDPLKYIHWKATAKTGRLKTKELSSLAYQPIVIDFERIDISEIEEKISCTTYVIMRLVRMNIPIGLRMRDKLFHPDISHSHKITMLTELALYGS